MTEGGGSSALCVAPSRQWPSSGRHSRESGNPYPPQRATHPWRGKGAAADTSTPPPHRGKEHERASPWRGGNARRRRPVTPASFPCHSHLLPPSSPPLFRHSRLLLRHSRESGNPCRPAPARRTSRRGQAPLLLLPPAQGGGREGGRPRTKRARAFLPRPGGSHPHLLPSFPRKRESMSARPRRRGPHRRNRSRSRPRTCAPTRPRRPGCARPHGAARAREGRGENRLTRPPARQHGCADRPGEGGAMSEAAQHAPEDEAASRGL